MMMMMIIVIIIITLIMTMINKDTDDDDFRIITMVTIISNSIESLYSKYDTIRFIPDQILDCEQ